MSLGRGGKGELPRVRLDDALGGYDVARDGRSGEGRVQHVRLDRIEASPYQVRLVFPDAEIEQIADSVLALGLIHEPRARPHPSRVGWVELMPGEMRVRALRRLVERGDAEAVLGRDAEGHWLVPVRLEPTDDARADAMIFGENFDRTDLSPWEWALAFQGRRNRLRERGRPAGVRDVAASMGKRAYQTIGEYLQVADALTAEVLVGAGVAAEGCPDHARLARLPLAALLRVARAGARSPTQAAQRLLAELKRAGDPVAAEVMRAREAALAGPLPAGPTGFQVNIRQALEDVPPRQAVSYLVRMAPAVQLLAARVAEDTGLPGVDALAVADRLAAAVCLLRGEGAR